MLSITKLRTEYLENPIGIDAHNPRLSWVLKSSRQNVMQESYRVLAASDAGFSDILWDSGVVVSADSVRVRYQGQELISGQRVFWKVFVTAGEELAESETAIFEMGLLGKNHYICVVLDLYSRMVISYGVSRRNSTQLIRCTFQDAYNLRSPSLPLTFHSDRGSNYRSDTFCNLLEGLGITQSFSKASTPYDNSVIESFSPA